MNFICPCCGCAGDTEELIPHHPKCGIGIFSGKTGYKPNRDQKVCVDCGGEDGAHVICCVALVEAILGRDQLWLDVIAKVCDEYDDGWNDVRHVKKKLERLYAIDMFYEPDPPPS